MTRFFVRPGMGKDYVGRDCLGRREMGFALALSGLNRLHTYSKSEPCMHPWHDCFGLMFMYATIPNDVMIVQNTRILVLALVEKHLTHADGGVHSWSAVYQYCTKLLSTTNCRHRNHPLEPCGSQEAPAVSLDRLTVRGSLS